MGDEARGRIVDEEERGIARLVVEAWDARVLAPTALVAETRTDAEGVFALRLADGPAPSDVRLRVHDRGGIRLLHEGRADEPLPPLPRREAEGWLVTDGAGRPTRVAEGCEVEWLIDGEAIFAASLRAAQRARRSLHVQQLLFKPDFAAAFRGATAESGVLMADALVEACRRGARVRVLLNENAVVPDDVDEVRAALADAPPGSATVRGLTMSPEVMHAKAVIADDEEAIVVGLPFEPRWWDTRGHALEEPLRGKGLAMHDVGARLRGPGVALVAAHFAELWNASGRMRGDGDELPAAPPLAPASGGATVQALLTMPDGRVAERGETGVLQAYERMLAQAERFVYVETQYFTSPRIARAVARALRASPKLEVILVVNEHMDVPLGHYDRLMAQRLAEMGWPEHPRLGAFSLWSHAREEAGPVVRPVYVHSKTAIADDAWATVGSANLDGYSLDSAEEFALRNVRCVEWNLAVLDGIEGAPATGTVRALRTDLWSEHLGRERATLEEEPPEGWLALWRRVADENLSRLARGNRPQGFALRHGVELPPGVEERGPEFNIFNRR